MIIPARFAAVILALVSALLIGCSSSRSTVASAPVSRFDIVETSMRRELTPHEMTYLQIAVAKYLDAQKAVAGGDYYVKVFLTPDREDGTPGDWVVVRYTRSAGLGMELLAYSPASYYGPGMLNYYPFSSVGFSRIGFRYYDDPFYGNNYYFPPGYGYGPGRPHSPHHNGPGDGGENHGNGGSGSGGNHGGNGYDVTPPREPRPDNGPSQTPPPRQPRTRSELHRPREDVPTTQKPVPARSESSPPPPAPAPSQAAESPPSPPQYDPPVERSSSSSESRPVKSRNTYKP